VPGAEPAPADQSRLSRWAMTSRALWGGAIALVVALVIVGGTLAGSAIASRRSPQAAQVAVATYQAAAARPVRPRPPAVPPEPELGSPPGQIHVPPPAIADAVPAATAHEIKVNTHQAPTQQAI